MLNTSTGSYLGALLEIQSPNCIALAKTETPGEVPREFNAQGNTSDINVRISDQTTGIRLTSMTYTQAWINHLDEVNIEDVMAACGGYRGPFSDVTILDHNFSRAPSVVTDLSSIHGDDDPRRAEKLYRMAENLFKEKLYNGALEVFQKVYLLRNSLPPDKIYHLTFRIGLCLAEMRNLGLAEKVFKYAVQLQVPSKVSTDHQQELHHFLARTLARQDKWPQASLVYADLWSGRAEVLRQPTAKASAVDKAIRTGQEYSKVLVELGEGKKALEVLEIIQSKAIEMRGINDKVVFNTLLDFGRAHCQVGQVQQAESILNDLLLKVKSSPVHTEMVGACWHGLAVAAYRSHRYDESQRMARLAVESRTKNGEPTISSITSSRYVALAKLKLGDIVNAKSSFQDLRKQALSIAGSGHVILVQLDIDLAHIYLHQHQYQNAERKLSIAAESLMPQLEKISAKTAASTHPVSRQLLEQLAPLMVRNAWSLDVAKKNERFTKAVAMYQALHILHGNVHGRESTIYLQTGHDYGSLCLWLNRLKPAGDVLEEVWETRSKTLGADDPATMRTALQLGQTHFARNLKAEGLSILNSVFELSTQSASPSNLHTIQSAEILGHYYMWKGIPKELARDPFVYIKAAFDARQAVHGPTQQTCRAALEVAFFSLKKRDRNLTKELLDYVFEQGNHTLTSNQNQNHMRAMVLMSGLASSALTFASNRKRGNRKMCDIIARASAMFGSTASITDQVRSLYAIILVAQNRLSASIDILRTVYQRRLDLSGRSKLTVKSLGVVLGGVLALRALVRGSDLPMDLDAIDSKMEPSFLSLTRMQLVAAILAYSTAGYMWTQVSRPLLKWIYRRQKNMYGRFSRETLTVLAIMHAWRSYRLVSRVRRKSNENEPIMPEVKLGELMDGVWPTCTQGLNAGLELMATQKSMNMERFFRLMNTQIAKQKLWEQFTSQLGDDIGVSETSKSFFNDFDTGALPDCWDPPQVPMVDNDDDTVSQVWTINSEEEEQIEADSSIDLMDILGLQREGSVSSFVGSLLNLTSSSQAEVERAENCIDQIGTRLVDETINGTDMDKVKNERVQLEIEAGVWDENDDEGIIGADER